MANGWKITAIIVLIILILENLLFFYAYKLGVSYEVQESYCRVSICGSENSTMYDAYNFDTDSGICYCYKDGDIVHREVLR